MFFHCVVGTLFLHSEDQHFDGTVTEYFDTYVKQIWVSSKRVLRDHTRRLTDKDDFATVGFLSKLKLTLVEKPLPFSS